MQDFKQAIIITMRFFNLKWNFGNFEFSMWQLFLFLTICGLLIDFILSFAE
ncbi:MAG TPA: hypothetical protein VJ845_00530 [Haploplasma sp.]|nr:hypothetical protein [Haploplasma sp.]